MDLKTIPSINRDIECPLDGCNDPLTQNASQEFETLSYTLFLAERGANDEGELGIGNVSKSDRDEQKLNSLMRSADLSTMEAKKVETRNREPSCTFHNLSGTQIQFKGVPILAYLCP
tara:strand:- start:315 stop:665 length:351 start_codon:yes stop_codon:yes gene_type:complete